MTEYDKLREYYIKKIYVTKEKIFILSLLYFAGRKSDSLEKEIMDNINIYKDIADHLRTIEAQEAGSMNQYKCEHCAFHNSYLCKHPENISPCEDFIRYNNDKGEL